MEILMKNPLLVIVGIGFLALILVLAFKSSLSPYIPVKALLTDAELNFYRQLIRIVPPGILVFSKVRIADVIDVKPSIKGKGRLKHFNPIAAKHFDFVLVDDKKMQILGAIELNDSSHDKKERKERDEFVRKVMASAKVPLFEIKATRKYKLDTLKSDLEALLARKPLSPAVGQVDEPISEQDKIKANTTVPAVSESAPDVSPDLPPEPQPLPPDSLYLPPNSPSLPPVPHTELVHPLQQPVLSECEPVNAQPGPAVADNGPPLSQYEEYKPKPLSSFMDEEDIRNANKALYDDPIELSQRLKASQN